MLSNFFNRELFAIFLKEAKTIKYLRYSTIKRVLLRVLLVAVIIGAVYAAFSPLIIYRNDIKNYFSIIDLGNIFLVFGFYVSYIACFISVLAYTYFYGYLDKDINNYIPLPIKPLVFSTTKLVTIYVGGLKLTALVFLPFLIMYLTLTQGLTLSYLIIAAFYILSVPLVITALISLVEGTILFFVNKIKNKALARGVIVALFMVIVFALYFGFIFLTTGRGQDSQSLMQGVTNLMSLYGKLKPAFFYANWTTDLLNYHSLVKLLLMLGTIIIGGGLSIFYFSKVYFAGVVGFNEGGSFLKRKKNVKLNVKSTSISKWFFINEVKTIFRTPAFVMNILFGNVLVVIIYLCMLGYSWFIGGLNKEFAALDLNQYINIPAVILAVLAVGTFFTIFNLGCASSISREAKNIKAYFSMPIDFAKAFSGKIIFYFLVEFITLAVFLVIPMLVLKLSLIKMLVGIITMIIICLATVLIPICIDLVFYNFDWESETAVVKRSKSMFISLIASLIFIAIVYGAGILMFVYFKIDYQIVAYILLGFYLVLILATLVVYNKLIKRFMRKVRDF